MAGMNAEFGMLNAEFYFKQICLLEPRYEIVSTDGNINLP